MDVMPMMATETGVTKIKETQLHPRSSCKKIYINHYVENIVFMGHLREAIMYTLQRNLVIIPL